jgi:hypothetical protein
LSSELQQWTFLYDTLKATGFHSRQRDVEQFFITQGELSACKNAENQVAAMNIRYNMQEWRLFIDCYMHGLTAVLLQKGQVLLSSPVAYTVHKKETYENMKEILSCVKCKTYQWHTCGDFKVTATLMGPK